MTWKKKSLNLFCKKFLTCIFSKKVFMVFLIPLVEKLTKTLQKKIKKKGKKRHLPTSFLMAICQMYVAFKKKLWRPLASLLATHAPRPFAVRSASP
jgi:hypothetical protein